VLFKILLLCWAPVTHTCNLSYSEGGDQEYYGSKPAWANSLQDPISKNCSQKLGWWEWFKVKNLSSSPSTTKKCYFDVAKLKYGILFFTWISMMNSKLNTLN
jgi:hypothetical protein